MLGRVLGAGQGITDVVEKHGVPTPVTVAKQPTRRLDRGASRPTHNHGANWGNRLTIAFVVVTVGFGAVVFTGWPVDLLAGTQQGALTAQSFAPDFRAVRPQSAAMGAVGRDDTPRRTVRAAACRYQGWCAGPTEYGSDR